MLKVGLTGGLASGTTFVGEALASRGCLLIQADELGHETLAPGGEAYDAVVREFGREILTDDGLIDRQHLATQAFGCLLYTSDAADEEDSVDLGGRRVIK